MILFVNQSLPHFYEVVFFLHSNTYTYGIKMKELKVLENVTLSSNFWSGICSRTTCWGGQSRTNERRMKKSIRHSRHFINQNLIRDHEKNTKSINHFSVCKVSLELLSSIQPNQSQEASKRHFIFKCRP